MGLFSIGHCSPCQTEEQQALRTAVRSSEVSDSSFALFLPPQITLFFPNQVVDLNLTHKDSLRNDYGAFKEDFSGVGRDPKPLPSRTIPAGGGLPVESQDHIVPGPKAHTHSAVGENRLPASHPVARRPPWSASKRTMRPASRRWSSNFSVNVRPMPQRCAGGKV